MKKLLAAAAMLLSVSMTQVSCKGGGASEVGKWEVVDISSPDMKPEEVTQAKAMLGMAHMTWEFKQDGKTTMTMMGQTQDGSYTRSGQTLEVADPKTQKKEKMEISTLTNDQMVLKGSDDGKTMTMTLKRAK